MFRGHYRTDTRGANLNRYYLNPDPSLHPSIYAARSLILHYHQQGQPAGPRIPCDLNRSSKTTALGTTPSVSRILHLACDGLSKETLTTASPSSPQAPLATLASRSLPPRTYTDETDRTSSLSSKSLLHQLLPKPPHKTLKASPLTDTQASQASAEEPARDSIRASEESGLALYVDLHAHASKRGVFMYGNHFSNVSEAAENMLFPRLLSLNSPHLDFDHCVFTERNMYAVDRREGTSKEGSGRVAVHKATAIIPW